MTSAYLSSCTLGRCVPCLLSRGSSSSGGGGGGGSGGGGNDHHEIYGGTPPLPTCGVLTWLCSTG